jgi:hypothetical protein
MQNIKKLVLSIQFFLLLFSVQGQTQKSNQYYASWGYNRDYYFRKVNINVVQPGLNNDYRFLKVQGHDKKEAMRFWDYALTIPQYNVRIGFVHLDRYLFEINFDHTKFVANADQVLHMTGTYQGRTIDTFFNNSDKALKYQLNNGANFFLLMAGRKFALKSPPHGPFRVDGIVKAGGGFVYPHVENTIMGQDNKPHFQLGGFNVGVEGTLRFTFWNLIYLEPAVKLDYARYWGLKIYEGKASQSLYTAEAILSLGVWIPNRKVKVKESVAK